jgi:hypothetical protein
LCVYSITNILALLQDKIHLVEWDSHQEKGITTTAETTLQEGLLKVIQVHASERYVLIVLAV